MTAVLVDAWRFGEAHATINSSTVMDTVIMKKKACGSFLNTTILDSGLFTCYNSIDGKIIAVLDPAVNSGLTGE
jgi:hypothetical protein